jgi:hypothetical protein
MYVSLGLSGFGPVLGFWGVFTGGLIFLTWLVGTLWVLRLLRKRPPMDMEIRVNQMIAEFVEAP